MDNMRALFPEYYPRSDPDFAQLWLEAQFSFDANVLLNLFRVTSRTQERLFTILEGLRGRIWLSHQAGKEFMKHWDNVSSEHERKCDAFKKAVASSFDLILKEFGDSRHPMSDDVEQCRGILEKAQIDLAAIAESKKPSAEQQKQVLDRIEELFAGKVGAPFSPAEYKLKCDEADKRFRDLVPPGYSDSKSKVGNDKYGDAIMWFQLLDYVKSTKKPMIFVTDDAKQDWLREEHGQKKGGRPELLREMLDFAGEQFHMYRTDRFMEYAADFLKLGPDKVATAEVKEVSHQRELAVAVLRSFRDLAEAVDAQAPEAELGHAIPQPALTLPAIGDLLLGTEFDASIADIIAGRYPFWDLMKYTNYSLSEETDRGPIARFFRELTLSLNGSSPLLLRFELVRSSSHRDKWKRIE
jgi:hypothetical protein